jgi:3-dehydroquinate synthase class II
VAQQWTDEERELLQQARLMKDIFGSKAWAVYSSILESQIKAREAILLDSEPGQLSELKAEQIKGARLGLRLALDTVTLIIEDAKDLVGSTGRSDEETDE